MAQTSKGTVAGVLDIIAGISGLVGGIPLLVIAIVGSGVLGALPDPDIRPLAILPLAIFLPLALLCFLSGVIAIVGGIPLLVIAIVGSGVLGALPDPDIRPLAILPLAIFLPLALLCFLSGVIAIVGGIAAFNRRRWGLAVAGSIAAVFGFFPVGIAAVIFTILAEPEFRPSA